MGPPFDIVSKVELCLGLIAFPNGKNQKPSHPMSTILDLERKFFRVKGILSSSTSRPRVITRFRRSSNFVESVAYNISSKLALEGR